MLGRLQIGTTRRGIGPTYADKASRVGIRVQDLLDEKILRAKIQTALSVKNVLLRKIYHQRPLDKDVLTEATLRYAERIRPFVADTSLIVNRALDEGKMRALRGRPGHAARPRPRHLSVRHQLATRSPAAPASGWASGPTRIDAVLGVAKAYLTRVGAGGFPSEADEEGCAADPRAGRRVRHRHRPRPALRLARPGRPALRRPHQRPDPAGGDEAGRALDLRPDPGLHRLPAARRHRRRRLPGPPERLPPRRSRSTRSSRAGTPTSPASAPFRPCRRPPAATSSSSRSRSGCPLPSSAPASGATRSSPCTRSCGRHSRRSAMSGRWCWIPTPTVAGRVPRAGRRRGDGRGRRRPVRRDRRAITARACHPRTAPTPAGRPSPTPMRCGR